MADHTITELPMQTETGKPCIVQIVQDSQHTQTSRDPGDVRTPGQPETARPVGDTPAAPGISGKEGVPGNVTSDVKMSQKLETVGIPLGGYSPPVPDFSWSSYIQGIGVLFFILGCLWFAVRFMRRYGRFPFMPHPEDLPKDALRMEAQMPIGPRKGLMVVRFFDQRLLLGVTDGQITLLTREHVHEEKTNFNELMENAQRNDAP